MKYFNYSTGKISTRKSRVSNLIILLAAWVVIECKNQPPDKGKFIEKCVRKVTGLRYYMLRWLGCLGRDPIKAWEVGKIGNKRIGL